MITPEEPRSAEQMAAERTGMASGRTDLAAMRTLMAADRTLMAWVRTSLSLLSFGFTIYPILEQLPRLADRLPGNTNSRGAGLFLAAMGTFAMVMGTVDYWQTLKQMQQQRHFSLTRPALVMALLMSLIGLTLFVSISAGFL